MCAKLPKKEPQSTQTVHFVADRQLLTGQVLAARYWLQRYRLPLSLN